MAAVCLAAVLAGCAADTTDENSATRPSAPAELSFGFSGASTSSPGAITFLAGLRCYVEQNGGELKESGSNFDVNRQITDLDQYIAEQKDVIALAAVDARALTGTFAKAASAGISVIEVFNPASQAPGQVSEDSTTLGLDVLEKLAEQFPDGADAVVIGGFPAPLVQARVASFTDNAADFGINVVEQVDSQKPSVEEGRALADVLLTKHPDVDVVFTWLDVLGIGAGLAGQARGRTDLVTIGADVSDQTIKALKDGTLTAAYDPDLFALGMATGDLGRALADGEDPAPHSSPLKRYDQMNADTWVPADQRCE